MKLSQVLSSINQIEKSKFISCLVLLLTLTPMDTSAAILSIEATGKADYIDPALAPFIEVNDSLAISFQLDTDVADSATSRDNFGWYEFNQSLQFSIGSATGTAQGYTGSVTDGPYQYLDDDAQQQ